jgi:hypothetical protein
VDGIRYLAVETALDIHRYSSIWHPNLEKRS